MAKPSEKHVDLNPEQWATVKAALAGEITELREREEGQSENMRGLIAWGKNLVEQVITERERAEEYGERWKVARFQYTMLAIWTEGLNKQSDTAQERLAAAQGALRRAIRDFVERVNSRAEAEMHRTGTLEGAHHRAIEAELAALPKEEKPCGHCGGHGSCGQWAGEGGVNCEDPQKVCPQCPRHPRHRNA